VTIATEPLYATLAARLRQQIAAGAFADGKLPSEATLAREHDLARGTVRSAIDELVAEGLVISHNGRGHYVRTSTPLVWRASDPERNTDTSTSPSGAWARSVRAQGREPAELIGSQIGYADDRIAAWLDLPVGEPVSIRRRVRLVDGEQYSTADSWYPRSIVAGTEVELPGDVLPGIYAVFERLGRPWVRTVDRWIARPPTRDEARELHIPRGVAVAEVVRRSFDAAGIPVRLSIFVLPGDRHEIEYEHTEDPS